MTQTLPQKRMNVVCMTIPDMAGFKCYTGT